MFVVRRAFRGPSGCLSAGSIIDPADMKKYRYHVQEKHIVEVTEHNYARYAQLFKDKYGIDIPNPADTKPVDIPVPGADPVNIPIPGAAPVNIPIPGAAKKPVVTVVVPKG
jgi:hypothetical protein